MTINNNNNNYNNNNDNNSKIPLLLRIRLLRLSSKVKWRVQKGNGMYQIWYEAGWNSKKAYT